MKEFIFNKYIIATTILVLGVCFLTGLDMKNEQTQIDKQQIVEAK